jgi:hypothetical protein
MTSYKLYELYDIDGNYLGGSSSLLDILAATGVSIDKSIIQDARKSLHRGESYELDGYYIIRPYIG